MDWNVSESFDGDLRTVFKKLAETENEPVDGPSKGHVASFFGDIGRMFYVINPDTTSYSDHKDVPDFIKQVRAMGISH